MLIPMAAGFISASFGIYFLKHPLQYWLINGPIIIMSVTIQTLLQYNSKLLEFLNDIYKKENQ